MVIYPNTNIFRSVSAVGKTVSGMGHSFIFNILILISLHFTYLTFNRIQINGK